MWAVEYGNSEVKVGTATVELQSNGKSRGVSPSPCYSPHDPFPTLPLLSSALLLAQHTQKSHTKVEGREGDDVN